MRISLTSRGASLHVENMFIVELCAVWPIETGATGASLLDRGLIRGRCEIRVLVAFEENYRAYRETMATCLQIRRPDIEVDTVELATLEKKLEDFAPQVVICSGHRAMNSYDECAWIALSLDLNMPARIKVDGRFRKMDNPTLEQILAIIGEIA